LRVGDRSPLPQQAGAKPRPQAIDTDFLREAIAALCEGAESHGVI
jgi:hypothetical protein